MHITVVGGGLGGLAAAALAARAGATVTLLERAAELGGRARSPALAGCTVNLGPHALYRRGAARRVLRSLGVEPAGGVAPASGWLDQAGGLLPLPASPAGLWRADWLGVRGRVDLVRGLSPVGVARGTVTEWLAPFSAPAHAMLRAAVRVSSYAHAPDAQSAAAAQAQLRRAQAGVEYLDGGWAALVAALEAVLPPGVVRREAEVNALPDADAVVLAVPPAAARRFGVEVPPLTAVRAACLDLVLDALPVPGQRFVLGLDAPTYVGEHGGVAQLGGTVVHAAQYLAPGERGDRATVEAALDHAQPGWRAHVRAERWLPELVVTHRLDEPGQVVSGARRVDGRVVALVGDWVGEEGMLLDRALASAEVAVAAALRGAR